MLNLYSYNKTPEVIHMHEMTHTKTFICLSQVACTNWKRILMILAGKWNDTDVLSIPASLAHTPGMFRNMSTFTKPERDFMLDNYHKMIIVRNPFERLLSAFRNKLEGDAQSAKYFQVCYMPKFVFYYYQIKYYKVFKNLE